MLPLCKNGHRRHKFLDFTLKMTNYYQKTSGNSLILDQKMIGAALQSLISILCCFSKLLIISTKNIKGIRQNVPNVPFSPWNSNFVSPAELQRTAAESRTCLCERGRRLLPWLPVCLWRHWGAFVRLLLMLPSPWKPHSHVADLQCLCVPQVSEE